MAVRKLGVVEVVSLRAPVLRQYAPSEEATAFAAQYVCDLDESDGLEGHRVYWGTVGRFLTSDGRYEHACVRTILEHSMRELVIVRDRVRAEILGHYFADLSEFPFGEEIQTEPAATAERPRD